MSETESADAESEAGPDREFRPWPTLGIFALFFAVLVGGLLLADAYQRAGLEAVENSGSVGFSVLILVEILVVTAVFLLAQRYGYGQTLIRLVLVAVFGFITYLVFTAVLGRGTHWLASAAPAAGLAAAIWFYPEWYVLDAAAVLGGAGMVAQFGISLEPFPIVVLLVGMAVYDAYSVYVSGHMKALAKGVGDLRLPMVFVVPASPSYSLLDSENILSDADEGVAFLGLGDAFFPGMLAVSAGVFVDAPRLVAGVPLNLPALGALLGGVLGMVLLQLLAYRVEGVHAGLPALNGSVLVGYALGAVAAGVPLATALGP